MPGYKEMIRNILGEIPLTAEFYYELKKKNQPFTRYSLKNIQANLDGMLKDIDAGKRTCEEPKKILVFASLHYWIEHAVSVALYFGAMGHKVTFGYLPYCDWQKPVNKFDLRRQDIYTKKVLAGAEKYIDIVSFLPLHPSYKKLPDEIMDIIREVSAYDTQYTLQVEDFSENDPLYQMRLTAMNISRGWLTSG